MKKNRSKYTVDLPRRLYTFFLNYSDTGVPSFSKFARSIGATLDDVERFREHGEFERAYQECSECAWLETKTRLLEAFIKSKNEGEGRA